MDGKTKGQRLYEHKHPPHVEVVLKSDVFRRGPAFWIDNPNGHTPWRLLTQSCRDSWERSAEGHYLFAKEQA